MTAKQQVAEDALSSDFFQNSPLQPLYPPDYTEEEALRFMGVAMKEAHRSFKRKEVTVGCAYVDRRTKEILESAGNKTNADRNATRHCEFVAFDRIWERLPEPKILHWEQLAPYVDLFVTCEPCIMCTGALLSINVRRVIFGCLNDRFGGCGSVFDMRDIGAQVRQRWPVTNEMGRQVDKQGKDQDSRIELGELPGHRHAMDEETDENKPALQDSVTPPTTSSSLMSRGAAVTPRFLLVGKNGEEDNANGYFQDERYLTHMPLEGYGGLCGAEAVALLQKFYDRGNANAPEQKRKRPLQEVS